MKAPMKALAKLLDFLREGPARRETLAGAPADAGEMLVRKDGARLLTTALAAAIADGLVTEEDGLRPTPEATFWLARHAARFAPEPFARQHRRIATETVEGERVAVNRNHSPLARLSQQTRADGGRWIERDAVEAGERLARDFELGALRQRVTSSWDPAARSAKGGRGGQADLGDVAIDARVRLDRALDLLGPELSGVVLDVCCFTKGTSQVERERRWPPRSAKLMLRTALDLLVRHYGLRAGEGRRPVRTRAWSAAQA